MLRHHIHVQAPVAEVLQALDRADFAAATTDADLNVVRLIDSVGAARDDSGATTIDLFDEDEGVEVAHLVNHLRALGMGVDQETVD
jgi:hypothetical protein